MTLEELYIRQNWTLEQKIDHTIGTIEAFIAFLNTVDKKPYISFSGGKDSTVLLDIARRFIDKDFKAVFCNTGNEWPEILRFVKQVENVTVIRPKMTVRKVLAKYGFPLVSKEQSSYIWQIRHTKSQSIINKRLYGKKVKGAFIGKISDRWQFLINMHFDVSDKCCECLKKRPFRKYERENREAPILGVMACESNLRKHEYIKRGGCNSFDLKRLASFPMSIWTDFDIWAYIQLFKIPYCSIYDIPEVNQLGCMFCGYGAQFEDDIRFEILFDLHPKAYESFMNYLNNGVTYREALRKCKISLPDENRQLKIIFQ